ncbi:hypothetical protein JQN72_04500 [Phycicoccus sp. CSK15P-2]|uniref:hypothetical protein n=1 Tax=Phycicoccus sp. CSK15P-2 TaxID=2807627 RepID=UPI0019507322|nr:hypothetical protein [Phycicoccus sp. CSK15P-2]MBM6403502.1 hypothetical protein [Phycicoccus sp. CSK15P-2]
MTGLEPVDWKSAYAYLELELESVLLRVAERLEQLEAGAGGVGFAHVRAVTLWQQESGDLESVVVADGASLSYEFAVYRDEVLVREQTNGPSNTLRWTPSRSGTYRVHGVATSASGGEADSASSVDLTVTVAER